MRNLLKYIILIVGLFFTVGCEKDPPVGVIDGCPEVYIDTPCLITFYGERGHQFKAPYFNPNNPNEFVYIEINYDSGYNHLCTYNFLTHEKRILTENAFTTCQPKWNEENKIAFNKNYDIFIVNSNGDSLEQITSVIGNERNLFPEWFAATNILTYENIIEGITTYTYTILFDISSNSIIDTVLIEYEDYDQGLSKVACSLDSVFAFPIGDYSDYGIGTFDYETNNFAHLTQFGFNEGEIKCLSWHPNNEDIFYTKYTLGIFKVNMNSGDYEQVVEGCFGKWYRFINISPDGNKIIAERIDTYYEDCTFLQTSSIVLLDIDGSNEVTILPKPE